MTQGQALNALNDLLNVHADVTVDGQVKCWIPDDDGTTSKTYLGIEQCLRLSEAFKALWSTLPRVGEKGGA